MLDASALGQLKSLKTQIRDATPRIEGTVKGTRKRFGFVIDHGSKNEYLLPQTEMEKVLPGDVVACVLETNAKDPDKPVAKIEKLISTGIEHCIGSVKEKNKQWYVVPDHPQLTRWLFIPPKHRTNLQEGDLVSATIIQHPYKNKGRVQAKVSYMIGKPDDPFIEHRFAIAKYNLPEKIWQPEELEAIRMTGERIIDDKSAVYNDCTEEHFFTIDGANTQDLDDAIAIKQLDDKWHIAIAIADASAFVEPNSPLDKIAQQQMSSIYLPAQKVSMLPDVLSSNLCSLKESERRLALICRLQLDSNGNVEATSYEQAVIISKAKLAYDQVSEFLAGSETGYSNDTQQSLTLLAKLTKTLQQWRSTNAMEAETYADYRLHLNDKGKIQDIEKQDRNQAQQMIEECMLLCNRATAAYLQEHCKTGLFFGCSGFKEQQMPGIKKLLAEHFPETDAVSLNQIKTLNQFVQQLNAQQNAELPFHEILKKKLERSQWHNSVVSHFSLGFDAYTTFTSPIRKYSDLLVHRIIKAQLTDQKPPKINDDLLTRLNQIGNDVRNAQRDCELNLKCQHLQKFKGKTFTGTVSMINHRMIGVYFEQFDVHGHIEVRSLNEEYTFKQESLQLITSSRHFKLGQSVEVAISNVDENQRQIALTLADTKDTEMAATDNA